MPEMDKDILPEQASQVLEPIGQLLRRKGLITATELGDALATQKTWGSRLGEVLIGKGYVTAQQFCRILAEQTGADFVDLMAQPPEPGLVHADERADYVERHFLPWRRRDGTLVLATSDPHPGLLEWAARHYGCPVAQVVTSPYDINWQIQTLLGADSGRARLRVAASVAWTWRLLCASLLLGLAALILLGPVWAIAAVAALAVACSLLVRLAKLHVGKRGRARVDEMDVVEYGHGRPLADDQLPVYSLLVPLAGHEEDLAALADAIRRLDYPRSKLDVKLIADADDAPTLDAAKRLRLESFFEIVRVPDARLGEAHMLSYALDFARGEYLAVLDGRTMPEADQLRRAVAVFTRRRGRYGILLAQTEDGQPGTSMAASLSAMERLIRTDDLEPGMISLGLPVPLTRGTHLSAATLRRLGGWRAGHVQPYYDLGIRAGLAGETIGLLQSRTTIASPSSWRELFQARRRRMAAGLQIWPSLALFGPRPARGLRGWLGLNLVLIGPFVGALLDGALPLVAGLGLADGLGPAGRPIALAALSALVLSLLAPILAACRVEAWRRRDCRPLALLAMPVLRLIDLAAAGSALALALGGVATPRAASRRAPARGRSGVRRIGGPVAG